MEVQMKETVSFRQLITIIKKNIILITSITVLITALSGIISYFVLTPTYQSSTQILVNQTHTQENYNYDQVKTNLEFINTYTGIIKSPIILEQVIDELDLNQTYEELSDQISVNTEENSQIISISIEDKNYALSVKIANTIASVFQKEIVEIMNVDNVKVLAPAVEKNNIEPIKPVHTVNIITALIAGLLASVGVAFLRVYFDNSIKTTRDVEEELGYPVLGVISTIQPKSSSADKAFQQTGLGSRRVIQAKGGKTFDS